MLQCCSWSSCFRKRSLQHQITTSYNLFSIVWLWSSWYTYRILIKIQAIFVTILELTYSLYYTWHIRQIKTKMLKQTRLQKKGLGTFASRGTIFVVHVQTLYYKYFLSWKLKWYVIWHGNIRLSRYLVAFKHKFTWIDVWET